MNKPDRGYCLLIIILLLSIGTVNSVYAQVPNNNGFSLQQFFSQIIQQITNTISPPNFGNIPDRPTGLSSPYQVQPQNNFGSQSSNQPVLSQNSPTTTTTIGTQQAKTLQPTPQQNSGFFDFFKCIFGCTVGKQLSVVPSTQQASNSFGITLQKPIISSSGGGGGGGGGSSSTSASTDTIPNAPTALSGQSLSQSSISLSWTAPSGSVTGYKIERSLTGLTWTVIIPNTNTSQVTFIDTNLSTGTSYTYRISAINAVGTSVASMSSTIVTKSSTPVSHNLGFIIFPPNPTSGTITVLKSDMQAGDGFISSRTDYLKTLQNTVMVGGLTHYVLAPRIGQMDLPCNLGAVDDMATFASKAVSAKQSGYDINTILYDLESWCWTPAVERNNFVVSVDNASSMIHGAGLKFGIQPTHDLLVQNYKKLHWQNIDFLLVQFQKYMTSPSSGYTQLDPSYISQVQDIITTAKTGNSNIKIYIQYNLYFSPLSVMEYSASYFANQINGVSLVSNSATDSDIIGAPFPTGDSPVNQDAFIKYIRGI